MIVDTLIKTCDMCPSQWEGKLNDGRMFYIRYRWGNLTIQLSKEPTNDVYVVMDNEDGEMIYCERLGDSFDGHLDESELIKIMESIDFKF